MTAIEDALTILFYVLLGTMTVAGLNMVRRHKKEYQVHFYMIMSVIRFTFVALIVFAHTLLADDRHHAISFALIFLAEYLVMMGITLTLIYRHK